MANSDRSPLPPTLTLRESLEHLQRRASENWWTDGDASALVAGFAGLAIAAWDDGFKTSGAQREQEIVAAWEAGHAAQRPEEHAPTAWLLTRAKSALENWGRHFGWCAAQTGNDGTCDCGLGKMIADLEPVPAPLDDEALDPSLLRMALKASWSESEALRRELAQRPEEHGAGLSEAEAKKLIASHVRAAQWVWKAHAEELDDALAENESVEANLLRALVGHGAGERVSEEAAELLIEAFGSVAAARRQARLEGKRRPELTERFDKARAALKNALLGSVVSPPPGNQK